MIESSESTNGFTDNETARLVQLSRLYREARALILYAEETDPESRSNLQIIKELRDAFDHLMRAISARLDLESTLGEDDPEYCKNNLRKAEGHVYRAAFDALDGTLLSLRVKIADVVEHYPHEALRNVVPDYWDIRRDLERLNQQVGDHRARKDVGPQVGETLDRYVQDVQSVREFHDRLLGCAPLLDEYVAKQAVEVRHSDQRTFWINALAAMTGGAIVACAAWLLNVFTSPQ